MVVRSNQSHAHHQHIRRGAVPLGQHSHHPDQVLPLPIAPSGAPIAEVAHVFPDMPTPAPRALGCVCCPAMAALVDPVTGHGYCAAHWISGVVQRQLD